jgi:hypothetical protein|tara:strand:- start:6 stop:392 length:387 start_codon:yes stop_codon:yes gene_type:complete
MSGLEYDKGDDIMKWKDIVLNNDKEIRKHKIDLKEMMKKTTNELDKMVLANDVLVQDFPELPRVNVYLNMDGDERIRVANGYQEDLYGGGFYAFDVAVNPKEFLQYGISAPSIIANKAMMKYMKMIRK